MFENIRNVITSLPIDRLRPNLGGHIPYLPDMSPAIWLPWRRPLPSNGALNILQLWASGGRTHEPILMKFGTQQHVRTKTSVTLLNIKLLKFKMADGRHVGKYSRWHNSPTNGPTGTQLGWSHPIMCPTCPLWCGCHGDGRCLATAHWTLCSHGRLEAERVNQFWWNLVCNSMLGPQRQSRNQI